jgi:hypothetical protein
MADVFISYAREDKDFVERLQKALKKDGREAWVDSEGILPSAEWLPEIFHAIEAAQAVLLVISPHSAASKVCSEEVAYATSQGKRIIPILRYEVDENLLPKPVRDRQWIFCRETDDFNSAIAALNSAIDTDLEWVRSHTRLLTHAIEWDKHNRDPSFGLRGSDLREAETFLTTKDLNEPRLLPLQIEYILSSRKRANSRITFAMGAISFALVTTVILAALFWEKRQESALNLAANFREMGISELASDNPLAAELLFARALSIDPNNLVAKERLIEARARSPQSRWISQTSPESTVLVDQI